MIELDMVAENMLKLEFTEESIEELRYERYYHVHARVQRKMSVLYLKSQGMAHKDKKGWNG